MNAVEARALGKRFGRTWALRDCTLSIPAGRVVALVGPNGAGKTTLLNLAVGLSSPSAGAITLLGGLAPGSPAALERVGYVAQDTPLYPNLSVADTLRLVGCLSRRFDVADATAHLDALGIPLGRRVGRLSGGQHAQVTGTWFQDPAGHRVDGNRLTQVAIADGVRTRGQLTAWLARHHETAWASFQPDRRFWHFQVVESSVYLLLALALAGLTVWRVRRRAA